MDNPVRRELRSFDTDKRAYIREPFTLSMDDKLTEIRLEDAIEYEFQMTLGVRQFVRRAAYVPETKKLIQNEIIEHLYGFIRRDLFELRRELTAMGHYEQAKKVNDLLDKIYD